MNVTVNRITIKLSAYVAVKCMYHKKRDLKCILLNAFMIQFMHQISFYA